ncbi:non-ribosomal peptide synthetase [Streptomyces sp. NBC_01411]|uniref:non-ribosomal peptide synthetase n=1 Tax=Streptomyces sp. NBC_01411 TaxID=2903857 RepID=UPI00324FA6A5
MAITESLDPASADSMIPLPDALTDGLAELSRAHDVSLELTLLAALAVLAVRNGGRREQLATVAASEPPRTQFRFDITDDPPFAGLLARSRLQGPAGTADSPAATRTVLRSGAGTDGTDDEFALTVVRSPRGLSTRIDHRSGNAGRWTARWHTLLAAIVAEPDTPTGRLTVLPSVERDLLLGDWCRTSSSLPAVTLVHRVVEAWAERTPDAVALARAGTTLTYRELNADANRLAHWLRGRGVKPEVAVALYGGSTVAMLTSMLAVLKAGGYYVPLDVSAPPARTAEVLAECTPRLVLTEAPDAARLPEPPADQWEVHDLAACDLAHRPADNPDTEVYGENLAYVMHTSGSTGRPKGVAMPHRALVRITDWYVTATSIEPGARVLQFSALSFDASFCEIFGAWHAGARVVLLPEEGVRRDPEALLDLLESERIDHLEAPYSGLLNIAHWAVREDGRRASRLRTVVTGGEQLVMAPDLVHWLEQMPGCVLRNGYGPSETSVATTHWLHGNPGDWAQLPPIGRPITNASVYLLDDALQPTPIGGTGEIYVGGDIAARGYAGRPGLTAERFVADPFGPVPGSRMYRTGDLARYRSDGLLEFLGRGDRQVKIRGFRIEPAEVEAKLLEHPQVGEVAVTLQEDATGRSLVAHIVARDAHRPPTSQELRAHAARILSDHMVPARFVTLPSLPLTPSGKLDRAALEAPCPAPADDLAAAEPSSGTVTALLGIWREVLAAPGMGITDDFFDLGGHSLLATRLISKVRTQLGKRVMVGDVFEYPTVELLAARIDGSAERPVTREAR